VDRRLAADANHDSVIECSEFVTMADDTEDDHLPFPPCDTMTVSTTEAPKPPSLGRKVMCHRCKQSRWLTKRPRPSALTVAVQEAKKLAKQTDYLQLQFEDHRKLEFMCRHQVGDKVTHSLNHSLTRSLNHSHRLDPPTRELLVNSLSKLILILQVVVFYCIEERWSEDFYHGNVIEVQASPLLETQVNMTIQYVDGSHEVRCSLLTALLVAAVTDCTALQRCFVLTKTTCV
jgi:hypothetical protein